MLKSSRLIFTSTSLLRLQSAHPTPTSSYRSCISIVSCRYATGRRGASSRLISQEKEQSKANTDDDESQKAYISEETKEFMKFRRRYKFLGLGVGSMIIAYRGLLTIPEVQHHPYTSVVTNIVDFVGITWWQLVIVYVVFWFKYSISWLFQPVQQGNNKTQHLK